MGRDRRRACLQDGPQLDINDLLRRGAIVPDANRNGFVPDEATISLEWGQYQQAIRVVAKARHFGGRQWYFICPVTGRKASILYKPPGANQFASRHAWRGAVAYRSQFLDVFGRSHRTQAKIKARLIGDLDPNEWALPPKPKWMRWSTYNRLEDRFDAADAAMDRKLAGLAFSFGDLIKGS